MLKKNKASEIFSWSLYDFANTSFTVIVITVVFPLYFKSEIIDFESFEFLGIRFNNPYDFFWGLSASISFFFVALSAPVLGALSDLTSRKKKYIFYYSLICIVSTSLIPLLESGDVLYAIILLIMGNIGFEMGIIYYDAFLPLIATKDKYSSYSGYGFAAGYFGAIISLAIAMLFIDADRIDPMVFYSSALFFFIFSLPFYFFVREEKKERVSTFTQAVKKSIGTVKNTIQNFDKFPAIRQFVKAFFFYINGVLTVISFGGIYAVTTLAFTTKEVIIFFLIVQFSAMLGSFLFAYLGKVNGEFKSLRIVLILWMFVCVLSFLASYVSFKSELFYFAGILAGIALGSSQSLSRSYYSRMIPKGKEAEFFGFYALSGRFAAILGPFVFGLVSSLTGRQEYSILSILIFFALGLYLLNSVPSLMKNDSD